jgi:hypothetical protein
MHRGANGAEGTGMSEPTTDGDRKTAERICKAIITQFGPGLTNHDKIYFVASHLAVARKEGFEEGVKQVNHAIKLIERAEQRERCASIAWEYGREESDPLYKDFVREIADEITDRIRNASLAPGEQPRAKHND